MDRRRWLLLLFIVTLIVAVLDVRFNGLRIFDALTFDFDLRTDESGLDEQSLPHVLRSTESTVDAKDVRRVVLTHGSGYVAVRGDRSAKDVITIRSETRASRADVTLPGADTDEGGPEIVPSGDELTITLPPEPTAGQREAGAGRTSDPVIHTRWTIRLPADVGLEVLSDDGILDVAGMEAAQRLDTYNTPVSFTPGASAPIDITIRSALLTIWLPKETANFDLEAVLSPGTFGVGTSNVTLERKREGDKTTFTAKFADGEHPLRLQAIDGHIFLHVSE